jgi:hypothetical protein
MKQFVVLKLYTTVLPDVVFQSNSAQDARNYCDIMNRSDSDHTYALYQLNEEH